MRLRIKPIGWALGLLLAITFVLDVIGGLLFPNFWTMYKAWELVLPGFTWLNWGTFIYGVIASFVAGWYIAIVFGLLYNYFVARESEKPAVTSSTMPAMEHH
jgi:hypothetical protein